MRAFVVSAIIQTAGLRKTQKMRETEMKRGGKSHSINKRYQKSTLISAKLYC